MTHIIVLRKIYEGELELSDEEYAEFLEDKNVFLDERDAWGFLDVIEWDIEEV